MAGLELGPGVWRGFPSAQWPSHPIRGRLRPQVVVAESLKLRPKISQFPLRVCFPFSQHWLPQPQRGPVLGYKVLVWVFGEGQGMGAAVWLPSEARSASEALPVHHQPWLSRSLLRCHLGLKPPRFLMAKLLLGHGTSLLWSCDANKLLEHQLGPGWGARGVGYRKPVSWQRGFSLLFCPLWDPARVHTCLTSRVQASHSPPASPAGHPTSQGGVSMCQTPRLGGFQYVATEVHSPGGMSARVISLFL